MANPCDPLTYYAQKLLPQLPQGAIIGSGTVLDTMRLRVELGHRLCVHALDVHVNVLGEHGDSQFSAFSSGNIGGRPLLEFPGVRRRRLRRLATSTSDAIDETSCPGRLLDGVAREPSLVPRRSRPSTSRSWNTTSATRLMK